MVLEIGDFVKGKNGKGLINAFNINMTKGVVIEKRMINGKMKVRVRVLENVYNEYIGRTTAGFHSIDCFEKL